MEHVLNVDLLGTKQNNCNNCAASSADLDKHCDHMNAFEIGYQKSDMEWRF